MSSVDPESLIGISNPSMPGTRELPLLLPSSRRKNPSILAKQKHLKGIFPSSRKLKSAFHFQQDDRKALKKKKKQKTKKEGTRVWLQEEAKKAS